MTEHLWLNVMIIVGIVGGAEEAVRRIVGRPVVRVWRKIERFLDAWNGEPARDGLAARPGMVERVIAIEAELKPNRGSSARDALNRIEARVDKAATMATASAEMATATKSALDEHMTLAKEQIEHGAKVETELRGAIADLSRAIPIIAGSTPHEETT